MSDEEGQEFDFIRNEIKRYDFELKDYSTNTNKKVGHFKSLFK